MAGTFFGLMGLSGFEAGSMPACALSLSSVEASPPWQASQAMLFAACGEEAHWMYAWNTTPPLPAFA